MGCGAAKATQTSETPQNITNEKNKILDTIGQEEKLNKVSDRPPTPVPKPVAFEIPIDPSVTDGGGDEDSIVKKHPPKRLARLEEQRVTIPTVDDIKEKQAEAEKRRQEIIEEKVAKARAVQAKAQGEKSSQKSSSSDGTTSSNTSTKSEEKKSSSEPKEDNNKTKEINGNIKDTKSNELTNTKNSNSIDKTSFNGKDKMESKSNDSKSDGKSNDSSSKDSTTTIKNKVDS